jgi:hypothetical protein
MALVPTDIKWADIVGSETVADGGYVGSLMTIARAHIDEAKRNNEITQEEAGAVYTAMIPSAFKEGIFFGLNEALIEANTDKAIKDSDRAAVEAELAKADSIAKIEKIFGYSYTLDANGNPVIGVDELDGKYDRDNELILEKIESEDKQNTTDGILDKQKLDIVASTKIKDEQFKTEQVNQLAITANTRDTHGYDISDINNDTPVELNGLAHDFTLHSQSLKKAANEARLSNSQVVRNNQDILAIATNTDAVEKNTLSKFAKANHYSLATDAGSGEVTGITTVSKSITAINTDAGNTENGVPASHFHAEMLRARVEANIAVNTSKGYLTDAYYKQAKLLQELTFSLANAGVIGGDDSTTEAEATKDTVEAGVYGDLSSAMEVAMNGMVTTFGRNVSADTVTPFIDISVGTSANPPEAVGPSAH